MWDQPSNGQPYCLSDPQQFIIGVIIPKHFPKRTSDYQIGSQFEKLSCVAGVRVQIVWLRLPRRVVSHACIRLSVVSLPQSHYQENCAFHQFRSVFVWSNRFHFEIQLPALCGKDVKIRKNLPMHTTGKLHSEYLLDIQVPIGNPAVRWRCLHLIYDRRNMSFGGRLYVSGYGVLGFCLLMVLRSNHSGDVLKPRA